MFHDGIFSQDTNLNSMGFVEREVCLLLVDLDLANQNKFLELEQGVLSN
jgi:hypothetical protein